MMKTYSLSYAALIALSLYSVTVFSQPVVEKKINNISSVVSDEAFILNLTEYFSTSDNAGLTFLVLVNSKPEVASTRIEENNLRIKFLSAGQTNITIEAATESDKVTQRFVAGVQPRFEGVYIVTDFNDLDLGENLYWNGSDLSGGFSNGLAVFGNQHNAQYGIWEGWAYSLMSDTLTRGYSNQYSAITGGGASLPQTDNDIYAMGYQPGSIKFTGSSAHQVTGMFITNSTYAALSMKYGDDFSKKFGGADGTEPDWFKLIIEGMRNGEKTGEVDFYLADFRYEDNTHDYIVETWQWIDLSELGKVDSLMFKLSSTDIAAWGMNTPAYFAIDNMMVIPDQEPMATRELQDVWVTMNADPVEINLQGLFTDPDDDDELIEISILSNSNTELVTVDILNSLLSLVVNENAHGESDIRIQAASNGKTVTVEFTLNVEDNTFLPPLSAEAVKVYPNPSDGRFLVSNLPLNSTYILEVFNYTGQLVHKRLIADTSQWIDLGHFPAGYYSVRLTAKEYLMQTPIIIK